jgi:hypothetical protein
VRRRKGSFDACKPLRLGRGFALDSAETFIPCCKPRAISLVDGNESKPTVPYEVRSAPAQPRKFSRSSLAISSPRLPSFHIRTHKLSGPVTLQAIVEPCILVNFSDSTNLLNMAPKQLNFVTGNKNKLIEVQAILGDVVDVQSQSLDLVEIQGTIEEISADKCRRAAEAVSSPRHIDCHIIYSSQVNGPVLVEDTCLCFNALKELPGPYMWVQFFISKNMA